MSNSLIGMLAAILVCSIIAGTIGGCLSRAHQVSEYNRINAPV